MSASGLELNKLSFAYDDGTDVVRDVSFSVSAGEIVSLLGPSGCGKTTCLRLAAGLEAPRDGTIRVANDLVAGSGVFVPPEKRHVGLVLQDFALFPHQDVLANVMFGMSGGSRVARRETAMDLLGQVGLSAYANAYPHQLSGGQQQRVALARALAPSPRVMLMDEPFSGLDVTLREDVRNAAVRVLKARGVPTLIVTHDPEEALRLSDRIAVMNAGRIVQLATPDEIYTNPTSAYVHRLFGSPNRFEALVEDGQVQTPLGPVPTALADGTRVEVLSRASALMLAEHDGTPATIVQRQLLGDTQRLHLEIPGYENHVVMETARRIAVKEGEPVRVAADPGAFHVFALDEVAQRR